MRLRFKAMPSIMQRTELHDRYGWRIYDRPMPISTWTNRIYATWLVFTGQADAFVWDTIKEAPSDGSQLEDPE